MMGLAYSALVLLFSIGPWVFKIDSWILKTNRYTISYLEDGTLVNVLLIGCLALSLPIIFLAGNKLKFNLATNSFAHRTFNKANLTAAKEIMAIVALSWLIMLYLYYSFIWYQPHLSGKTPVGFLASFSPFLHIVNNFLFVLAIERVYKLGTPKKTIFLYALFMSLLSLSFGYRGAFVFMLIGVFYFLSISSEIKISFIKLAFVSVIALFVFPFLGFVRFEVYSTPVSDLFGFFIQQNFLEGNIKGFFYDVFPLVGQNIVHTSGFVALYDMGKASSLVPYLASILNFFPRPFSELLGLPVDVYNTSAWYLARFLTHSGGSYLFAEPYWLGGYKALILFNIIYGIVFITIDKYLQLRVKQNRTIAHYLTSALLIVISFGYGFSGFVRALYIIIAVELFLYFHYKKTPVK